MVPLEPGRTLSHYRIVGKLGQGGQATAYRAEDLRLNRPVVMKALRPELAESEAARRRFEREACLCSALEHPNICAIYDMGEEDGLAYIVMQLVEGQTLKELTGGRPLEPLGGALDRHPDRGRAGRGPRQRHRPPRHQAQQHHGDARGARPRSWTSASRRCSRATTTRLRTPGAIP